MKIVTVRIQNFRGFKDETIEFNDYTCFVGHNGSGKSTVLAALNVFFRQYKDSRTDLSRLTVDDFHHKNVDEPIQITVTFTGLSPEAVADLAGYERQGKLIVSSVARYDPQTQRAEVKQYGSRMGFADFARYFEADKAGASAKDLQGIYDSLRSHGLPVAKTKPAMVEALRAFEEANAPACVPIQSEDQFYGATKGANRLAPHVQWIFVPAAKDFAEESEEKKTSALGQLLARTIRSRVDFSQKILEIKTTVGQTYQDMLNAEQGVLDELSLSLEVKLKNWAHPNATAKILWKQDPDKSIKVEEPLAYIRIGERMFEGELFRFGHGMQRSCMLTLLHELAATTVTEQLPTLVMGIEEPELYQHPPQARYLAEVLQDLAQSGAQIVLCSHSPLFIPGDDVEAIRVVREEGAPPASCIRHLKYGDLAKLLEECGEGLFRPAGLLAKLYTSLNPTINEMFFCKVLVLVESQEDMAYLATYLALEGRLADFRRCGCHIVPVAGKSNMLKPFVVAKSLDIPTFILFDADTHAVKEEHQRQHRKENAALLKASGNAKASDWPATDLWLNGCTIWKECIGTVAQAEIGEQWGESYNKACGAYGQPGGLDKNPLVVSFALEDAWTAGHKSASLTRLAHAVADFANSAVG